MCRTLLPIRSAMIAMLTGCFLPCGELAARAPEDGPKVTYRTTVDEVRLTFFSADGTGRYSRDLKASDFVVVDNDFVVRNFRSFTRLDATKIEAFVLIDASESVARQFRGEVNDLLQLINAADWIDVDKVSMLVFGGRQEKILCAGDCRTNRAWLQRLGTANGVATPLFDALVFAADRAAQHRGLATERAFIVFSDGEDTISGHSVIDAIDAAVMADAQVYTVDVNASGGRSQGGDVLHEMAAATGGRYYPLDHGAAELLATLSEYLRASYMVTYRPPSRASGFHAVRILPSHNLNLQFRCRYGYYYEKPVADGGTP